MIKYVHRKDLDLDKYNFCIENSIQTRVYAFSWYLDVVANHWDVLVLDDYEAVMPIPWKKKYGIKYVTQPYFCQQLGVYSKSIISEEKIHEFISCIPKTFFKIFYQFNSLNTIKLNYRTNYILSLKQNYEIIKAGYRKDRKYRTNQVKKKQFTFINLSIHELINIAKQYYKHIDLSNKDYLLLNNLISKCINENKGFLLGVEDNESNILGGAFFVKTNKRIYYLFSVVTPKGKKDNVATLLIDKIIAENCNSNLTLDFEGSMIDGIASFYKSFGGKPEKYGFLKQNNFSFLFK